MRIVIGAVITTEPFSPGMAWNWLQLAEGFRRLGHHVTYVERVDAAWCVDRLGRPARWESSVNRTRFRSLMTTCGLVDNSFQVVSDGSRPPSSEVISAIAGADVLFNMAGHLDDAALLDVVRRRVYVDQDPVYTQLWHETYGKDIGLDDHDVHLSVGLEVAAGRSTLPDCGRQWLPLLPVIVPDWWSAPSVDPSGPFCTIASWESFSDLEYQGAWYGSKRDEFLKFATLPRSSGRRFTAALRRHEGDPALAELLAGGWEIVPSATIADLDAYQRFIARSVGEIGIAKGAYVTSGSGWFGDRSAHFLASGRPVVAQGTGFERHLPTGDGLFSFADHETALGAVDAVLTRPRHHATRARELAMTHFGYDRVLPEVLERVTR